MITVRCEVRNRILREKLEFLLRDVGYSPVPPLQRRPAPDYRILLIAKSVRPLQIRKRLKLSSRARSQFIVFTDGDLDPGQLRSIFSGRTLSLHDINDSDAAKEAVERIRDDRFLKPLLRDLKTGQGLPVYDLLQGLLQSGDKGVAIIDRSFRDIFRNELHKKLVPGRPYTGRLCWQKFDHLADRTQPCINCPTHSLFISRPADPLPAPRLVVRNVDGGRVSCILLEVSPIKDPSRDNRVVASVENATRIDPTEKPAKEILENTLSVLLDMGFSRARVFAYNDATKSVRGFMEKSKDPAGLTGTTFQATVMPAGRYNEQVFKTKQPVVLSTKENIRGSFEAQILYDRFKKDNAPVWVEFPLLQGNQILGKLVLDKWSCDRSISQDISGAELCAVKPFVRFASKVLANLASYKSLDESATLTRYTGDIVAQLVGANSPEEIKSTLVESLVQEHLSDRVTSAFIRIQDREKATWRASEYGAGQHWELLASKATSSSDTRSLSVLACETRELFGELVSETEKSQLKRKLARQGVPSSERDRYIQNLYVRFSIPITYGDRVFGILAVQGKKELLDEDFLDNLRIVCSVAGSLLHLHGRINDLGVVKKYKSEMLRWFSHDATKSVIALRDSFIEPLKRGPSEDLTRLVDHADQLIDIISAEFLAYGWIGGKEMKWDRDKGDIRLRTVFEPIRNMVSSDASEVELDMSKVPDVKCRIDRLKTMAIVYNLIDNSVNAIRKKRSQIEAKKETSDKQTGEWKIEINASLENNNLLISIKDNGCGFRSEARKHIFEESSGQGLAVVKGFTELAGGKVACKSTFGSGAIFEVSIPI